MIGTTIADYRIEGRLGEDEMEEVFNAEGTWRANSVALLAEQFSELY
jgi:hypothetical protein